MKEKNSISQPQVHDQIKKENCQEKVLGIFSFCILVGIPSHKPSWFLIFLVIYLSLHIDLTRNTVVDAVGCQSINFLGTDDTKHDLCTIEPQAMTNDTVVTILIK